MGELNEEKIREKERSTHRMPVQKSLSRWEHVGKLMKRNTPKRAKDSSNEKELEKSIGKFEKQLRGPANTSVRRLLLESLLVVTPPESPRRTVEVRSKVIAA